MPITFANILKHPYSLFDDLWANTVTRQYCDRIVSHLFLYLCCYVDRDHLGALSFLWYRFTLSLKAFDVASDRLFSTFNTLLYSFALCNTTWQGRDRYSIPSFFRVRLEYYCVLSHDSLLQYYALTFLFTALCLDCI